MPWSSEQDRQPPGFTEPPFNWGHNIIGKLFGMLEGAEGPVANKEVEKGRGAQRF